MDKYSGLSNEDVIKNQKLYGLNIVKEKNNLLYSILYLLFPDITILIIMLIINLLSNNLIFSILNILLIIILFSIKIYYKIITKKINNKINKFFETKSKVIRNNKIMDINSKEITVGDIVILNKGNKITFDAIILESKNLKIDEYFLTNKDEITNKGYDLIHKNQEIKENYVYSPSFVIDGHAIVKVTSVGNQTKMAQKNKKKSNKKKTPLLKSINKLIIIIWIINIIIFIISLIGNFIFEFDLIYNILSSIIIFLVFIPNNINIFFKFLTNLVKDKLLKGNVVVKNIKIIEKLGLVNCLCLDKYKIITTNEMQIKEVSTDIDLETLLKHSLLTIDNKESLIEKSIKEYSNKYNININDYTLLKTYTSDLMIAKIYEYNGEKYIFARGTLESLFDICDLSVQQKYSFYNYQEEIIKKGYEVIAIGSAKISKIKKDIFEYRINFDGIIAFYNPPIDNIKNIINKCNNYNLKLILFSKDTLECNVAFGKEINLKNYNVSIDNKTINSIEDVNILKNVGTFSNLNPNQKLNLIDKLKKKGNFTLFVANNIYEYKTIKKSDIGVSFEKTSNYFEKEISDIILLNDNLENIVNTIKYNRHLRIKFKKLLNSILTLYVFGILSISSLIIFEVSLNVLLIISILYKILIYLYFTQVFKSKDDDKMPELNRKYIQLFNVKSVLSGILKGIILFTFIIILYIIKLTIIGG